MNNSWTFLGFSIIFYLLASINGEPFNDSDWLTELTDPMNEKQLNILQVENENLKLRLELVELNLIKHQTHLTKLDQQLSSFIAKYESENLNAKEDNRVENDLSTGTNQLPTGECLPGNEENGLPIAMNMTLNALQDIQSTLAKMENQSSIDLQQDQIKDELAVLNTIGKEKPMICIRNVDNKLVCSDVDLPTSCVKCLQNPCRIQSRLLGPGSFVVPCNDTTDGGGWTVIQRRVNDSVDFYRDWSDYKQGFGDLDGNYWIGLDKLHALTTTLAPVELRIELMDFDNVVKYAKYNSFKIGNESTKYIMENVGVYSGNAGDSFSGHKNKKFSTRDQDNDRSKGNCAQQRHGAWWYLDCYYSNLNGPYHNKPEVVDKKGIIWGDFHGYDYSLKFVQMMIRPRKS